MTDKQIMDEVDRAIKLGEKNGKVELMLELSLLLFPNEKFGRTMIVVTESIFHSALKSPLKELLLFIR